MIEPLPPANRSPDPDNRAGGGSVVGDGHDETPDGAAARQSVTRSDSSTSRESIASPIGFPLDSNAAGAAAPADEPAPARSPDGLAAGGSSEPPAPPHSTPLATQPTVPQLRPALELAWFAARLASQARPPQPVPGRIRPLLRAAKLGDRMLATVRQVVEDDSEFRGRVAELAEEERLGRLPWLWLVRPDGWEQEVESLIQASAAMAEQFAQEKDARLAQQRIAALDDELARAHAELAVLRRANEGSSGEVETEREARRESDSQRQQLESSLQAAQSQVARLRALLEEREGRIASLASDLAGAERDAVAAGADRDTWRARAGRLQEELAGSAAAAEKASSDAESARESVADAVGRAAAAAFDLASALGDATMALGGSGTVPGGLSEPGGGLTEPQQASSSTPDAGGLEPSEPRRSRSGGRRRHAPFRLGARSRRTPVALPPAVFEDSVQAAEHLVRVPDVLLVVDGYNVTLTSWPELELPDQRRRLVDALAELASRTSTSVELVFDGVEDGGWLHPPPAVRGRMRVEFSPSEVEADEVIIELVNRLDVLQPVIVATDDRRVRTEVSRAGANVISVAQLMAVLGRRPNAVR